MNGFVAGGTAEGAGFGLALMALIQTHPDPAAFALRLRGITAELQTKWSPAFGSLPDTLRDVIEALLNEADEEAARRAE